MLVIFTSPTTVAGIVSVFLEEMLKALNCILFLMDFLNCSKGDGRRPNHISPEKGLRFLIKGILELAKEPSRLCVDEEHTDYFRSLVVYKAKGAPVQRKPLNPMDYEVDLDSRAEPSRGRKVTLTIVGYGHDATALSPEPEEGGISQGVYYVYESDTSTGMGMESKMEQQVKAVTISSLSSLGFMAPQLKKPVAGMAEKATVVLNSVAGVEEGKTDIVDEGGISA
ncbi:dynamin-2A-like protein isoform X1 [Tanacetum coccineum]|uniref:Dynamin-2A-like protein isoform X1 n=1 Tax=Tanacetum coccineum TaxID=301880 RepID=A0ABQ4Z6A9_9ASTR